MPDPNWKPPGAATEGNRFFQKLGVYLAGVAIGLLFLGWVQHRKQAAQSAQHQAEVDATPDARPAPTDTHPASGQVP